MLYNYNFDGLDFDYETSSEEDIDNFAISLYKDLKNSVKNIDKLNGKQLSVLLWRYFLRNYTDNSMYEYFDKSLIELIDKRLTKFYEKEAHEEFIETL